jgi:hypothetical protein
MSLLAALNFDEASGAVLDVTGNGHGFNLDASLTRQAGKTGNGTALRHESTAANSPGPAIFGQTALRTLVVDVKRTSNSVDGWICEMKNTTADTGVFGFLFTGGNVQARVKNSSNAAFAASFAQPTAGTWYQLAMTYDGANIRLYFDGVLKATTAFAGPIWTSATIFPMMDTVGTETLIDNVRVYDEALDAAAILALKDVPVSGATVNAGTLSGSFSSPTASLTGATVPVDAGTLAGSFSSPTAAISANGSVPAVLSGAFSSPSASLAGASSASGQLDGAFSAPQVDLTGEGFPPDQGAIVGQFSAPISSLTGVSTASGSMIGTFSQPTFAGQGGLPQVDRDILFTITVGSRSAFELSVGAERASTSEAPQRTTIGVGNMDKQWRNGSEQYIDFTVTMLDPEAELSLAEAQAVPFQVAVTDSVATPARDDAAWVDPSVAPEVTEVDGKFVVLIKHMYEATATGLHSVWVKFGPTPESPIYQVTTFVVL